MARASPPSIQSSLFASSTASIDPTFAGMERIQLDAHAWIDLLPGWVHDSDGLFEQIVSERDWGQRTRWIYEKQMLEPRLTAPWSVRSGEPLTPPLIEQMRLALNQRYEVIFDSAGFNLYRDGKDSVAWHRDRISREVKQPIVALVSLGDRRKLHFRPRPNSGAVGPTRAFPLGRGDLLVTGGTAQVDWEHSIHKVARAGPRISIAFRYGLLLYPGEAPSSSEG